MTDQEQTDLPADQLEEMPPMALFAGTALLLAVTMAEDNPTERLEKSVKKMVELAQNATGAGKSLLDHTLATIKEHGVQYYMPGDEPQLEDVLHQIHRAHHELVSAVENGAIPKEEFDAFAENVRQVALAAVFIDTESEATQEQNEVLNYLYRVAQGEV